MVKKIVFFGPAAAGKTTMRRFLFEGTPAAELLEQPEPPSIGLKFTRYDYMLSMPARGKADDHVAVQEKLPVDLALVDTSGQEMEKWIIEAKDRVFSKADIVFFFFDASQWDDPASQEYIMDFISFTDDARIELAPDSEFHVVAHKCDTIIGGLSGTDALERRVRGSLTDFLFKKKGMMLDYKVHATSIVEPFCDGTFMRFMQLVTDDYSDVT